MGRKRKDENEKKIILPISIKKKYADEIKQKHENVSQYVEKLVKDDLKKE